MKSVGIAELKARLSQYLRQVRRGHPLTVLDRATPIARIVPVSEGEGDLVIREPEPGTPAPGKLRLPPPLDLDVDVVELLLEERQGER
jgi:prevent-host-death family protein